MPSRLFELARLFLKLGTISFGGPAAHIALMEEEVVVRRGWLSHEEFLDLLGATNLIPGPNAVEMAAHVGYRRAGLAGSVVGGVSFMLPAVLITAVLAWSYVRYGSLPAMGWLLRGIKPAVLAIIVAAIWRLGRKTLRQWQAVVVAVGVAVAALAGSDEIAALLVGSAVGFALLGYGKRKRRPAELVESGVASAVLLGGGPWAQAAPLALGAVSATSAPLWKLGLFFLKIGAVMYGTGYVLVAYLEGGLVGRYPGFGQAQLLDAVAAGQLTPGPLLTTATFVGYLLAGVPGAAVATVAIFLPSFLFVAAVNPLIPRLRSSPWASPFLDAVNAASLGLMAAVTLTLSLTTLANWRSSLIAAAAAAVSLRWKVSPGWLVLGGALAGWALG